MGVPVCTVHHMWLRDACRTGLCRMPRGVPPSETSTSGHLAVVHVLKHGHLLKCLHYSMAQTGGGAAGGETQTVNAVAGAPAP